MNWNALTAILLLALALGLVCAPPACAAAAKDKPKEPSPEEEEAEAAKEDAEEAGVTDLAQQLKKYQYDFHGTFLLPADPDQKPGRGVVGTFVTDRSDKHPDQTYLVKVASDDVLKVLLKYDTKRVTVQGKLRNQARYLIVKLVIEPPPPAVRPAERRPPGRL